jgi:molybdopterin biosynthesis enzyme
MAVAIDRPRDNTPIPLADALAAVWTQLAPAREYELLHADFALQKTDRARHYLLAQVQRRGGATVAVPCPKQGAAALWGLSAATGFSALAKDCEGVQQGDLVDYLPVNVLLGG